MLIGNAIHLPFSQGGGSPSAGREKKNYKSRRLKDISWLGYKRGNISRLKVERRPVTSELIACVHHSRSVSVCPFFLIHCMEGRLLSFFFIIHRCGWTHVTEKAGRILECIFYFLCVVVAVQYDDDDDDDSIAFMLPVAWHETRNRLRSLELWMWVGNDEPSRQSGLSRQNESTHAFLLFISPVN